MPENVNKLALVPLEKLAKDISMPIADANKLVKIYNSMRPTGENKINVQIINSEPFVKQVEKDRLQNFFETKLLDLNEFSRRTNIPYNDIKHMCDKCADDRISSLLPDTAKIRPFTLNSQYYLSINYIEKFENRIGQFNEIIEAVEERADEIDKEIAAELEIAEQKYLAEQKEEEESANNEEQPDETEDEYFDDDLEEELEEKEERLKKRRELQKKKSAEFRKEIEKGIEEYKKQTEERKLFDKKRAEVASELFKKQEREATELLKRQEEEKRKYAEHAEKVRNAVGDKYESNETNILEELRKNQEKFKKEQEESRKLIEEAQKAQAASFEAQEKVRKANEELQRKSEETKRIEEIQKTVSAIKTEEDKKRIFEETKRAEENARQANIDAQRKSEETKKAEQQFANNSYDSQQERQRAEEYFHKKQDEERIAQENARIARENLKKAEETKRAFEAMRTEEGRKRFEEDVRRKQEDERRARENANRAEEDFQRKEREKKSRETAQYEHSKNISNPIDEARKKAQETERYAKQVSEEYQKSKSLSETAYKEVAYHKEELHKINVEIEKAKSENNTAKVNVLLETSRQTQENLTKAINSAELYTVQTSTLKAVQSDAVAAAKSAQTVYNQTNSIISAEKERIENQIKIERIQSRNKSYDNPSSPTQQVYNNGYKPSEKDNTEIKSLEKRNAEIDSFIKTQSVELASSINKMQNDNNRLHNTYDAVSELSHKSQVETVEKQTTRNQEYTVLREQMYSKTETNSTAPIIPKSEKPYTPSSVRLNPIPISDEHIKNARMIAEGKDVYVSKSSTPSVTSGGTFIGDKETINMLKNAAFDSMSQSTTVAPPSERMTGTIDYGSHKVEYEFNKADADAFKTFAEKAIANKIIANETGKTISSTSQPPNPKFRPISYVKQSGEVTQINKDELQDDRTKPNSGNRAKTSETQKTQQTPVEQIKNQNKLHTRMDWGSIANTALASTARNVGRNLGKTEPLYGLTKTYRAVKGTAEVASFFFMTEGVRNDIATKNVTNFIKQGKTSSQMTYFMTQRYKTQTDFAKLNSYIEQHNAKLQGSGRKIKLIDETFGLGVDKGVVGSYSSNLSSLLRTNKIADISKLTNKDFDKLILQNPGLKSELLAHKKVNQLLQAKANSIQLTKGQIKKGMKGDVSKLTDAQKASVLEGIKDKNARKAFQEQTGIRGFNSKLEDKISAKGDRKLKRGYNKSMMDAENSAAELASSLLGGKYSAEQLKKMSAHDLESLLKSIPDGENAEAIRESLKAMINVKQMAEAFIKSMAKKIVNAPWDSYRRVAQNNESMAGYYELKRVIMSARGKALKTYDIGKKIFNKLNLGQTKFGKVVTTIAHPKELVKAGLKKIDNKLLKGGLQKARGAAIKKLNKAHPKNLAKAGLKRLDKTKLFNGRLKKARDKLVGKLISPLKNAFGEVAKLFADILNKLKKILMPIIKWILIIVGCIILGVLVTNFLLYTVGTVGGMITSFWENLWSENIMDSQAGKTLNNLISYDERFYMEIDKISNEAESLSQGEDTGKINFMKRLGVADCYGFYDPTKSSNESMWGNSSSTMRYHIKLPGMPYGINGFEQYYYDGKGNNVARYSNSKDILAVGYAAFDGEVNVFNKLVDNAAWGDSNVSYSAYCRELWENTHLCTECGRKFALNVNVDAKFFGIAIDAGFKLHTHAGTRLGLANDSSQDTVIGKGQIPLYGVPIPILVVGDLSQGTIHCHATPVYACTDGNCTGNGINMFTYYCNRYPQSPENDRTQAQKNFDYSIYDINVWKNEVSLSATSGKNNNVYLCVIDGDTSDDVYPDVKLTTSPGGLGCQPHECEITSNITKCTTWSDGHTEDYWGNIIGYYQYRSKNADGVMKDCWNQSTATGHTLKQVENGYCDHSFYVKHSISQTKNGSCGKSDDTCSITKYHGYTIYDDAYNRNGVYYNASYFKPDNCNYTTKQRYVRCDKIEKVEKTYTGTFHKSDGTVVNNYEQVLGFEQYTCSHKKARTETLNIDLYYVNDGSYAGYITVNVTLYDCSGKKEKIYICNGECSGYRVCGGHRNCKGHHFCNGHTMSYCTGHIDVYTKIAVIGIKDFTKEENDSKSIYNLANFGRGENHMSEEEVRDLALSIYDGDWEDLYNISFQRSESVAVILSESERGVLTGNLKPKEKGNHINITEWALISVARIPYYNGDACDMNNYHQLDSIERYKDFTNLVTDSNGEVVADSKGRVLMGLNNEKFIQYLYYSLGHVPKSDYQGTFYNFIGNNFKAVTNKDEIQAGDIYISTTTKGEGSNISVVKSASIIIKEIDKTRNTYLTVTCSDSAGTVVYGQETIELKDVSIEFSDGTAFSNTKSVFEFNKDCDCVPDES